MIKEIVLTMFKDNLLPGSHPLVVLTLSLSVVLHYLILHQSKTSVSAVRVRLEAFNVCSLNWWQHWGDKGREERIWLP